MNELKTPNPADPANRDPITKSPGAHPVGVGVGAAVGGAAAGVATAAATGAAMGTVAGPVGTAVGAAIGAVVGGLAGRPWRSTTTRLSRTATGAAMGTVAGPVGTAVGAAIGAVVGGLAGKAVAEHYDPTVEDGYWRENYSKQPYYNRDYTYDDYAPAYRLGGEARGRYKGRPFSAVESNLASDWERSKGKSRMTWDHAKSATRAAWDRIAD